MQNQLLLKIFSGPQVGAEIILNSGSYVMGLDDNCDLILHDQNMADKHLTLKVSGGHIFVRPFGQEVVMVGGERITEQGETEVPAFSIITAGTTHFGLGPVDEKWPMFFLPDLIDQGRQQGIDPDAKTKEQPLDDEPEEETLSEEEQAARDEKKRKHRRGLTLLVAVLLIGFGLWRLALLFIPQEVPGQHAENTRTPREVIAAVLSEQGLENLEVTQKDNGKLAISGYVVEQHQKTRLVRALRKAKIDVSYEVIAEDVLVESAGEVLGIYQLNLAVKSLGAGNIELRGFSEEAEPLLKAVRTMLADIPGIEAITNEVVTWPDLLDFFYKHLKEQNLLDVVKLELHGGKRLVVKGNLSPAQLEAWSTVSGAYNARYPDLLETSTQFNEVAPAVTPVKRKDSNRLALQIATVSVGNQRYITTVKGDKLFEGSRLPSGHIIKSIDTHKLILEYEGQEFEYQTGGGS